MGEAAAREKYSEFFEAFLSLPENQRAYIETQVHIFAKDVKKADVVEIRPARLILVA